MLEIRNITTDPLQEHSIVLPGGEILEVTFYFMPMQYGWFINNMVFNDFTLNGVRITNNPNMLRQFKNQLPFGLACFSKENREPSFLEDFASRASRLYVLTQAEVLQYEAYLDG